MKRKASPSRRRRRGNSGPARRHRLPPLPDRLRGRPRLALLLLLVAVAGGWWAGWHYRHRSAEPVLRIAPRPSVARPVAAPAGPPAQAAGPQPVERAALRVPRPLPAPPPAEPAWLRFGVPAPATGHRPLIAIVIDDLGLDRRRTAEVIRLPGPLTLSFMTYAEALPQQTATARRAGHELLLHVPMQPIDPHQDPGPDALYTSLTSTENLERLRWGLGRFDGFVGINNHMGSRFTADAQAMAPVMAELRRRGLLFLDSRTTAKSAAIGLAVRDGVPHAARDVFLDDIATPAAIDRQLQRLEQIARRRGSGIAIGHAHDSTIAALRSWLPHLHDKGLVLVPLTAIVRARMTEAKDDTAAGTHAPPARGSTVAAPAMH